MRIHASGSEFSRHLAEEIALLTGRSSFVLSTLEHDQSASRVRFVLERLRLGQPRMRFFGLITSPTYDTQRVRTLVEVLNVDSVDVRRASPLAIERVYVERGLLISADRVYFSSVEEDRGKKFFVLSVRVKSLDVRLSDEE